MAKKDANKVKEISKPKKNSRQLKVISVIIAIAFVVTLVKCGQQLIKLSDLKNQKTEYQVAYETALKQQEALKEQRALFEDATYLERQAKEKFGLVRPDEYVIMPAEEADDISQEKKVLNSDIH